MKKGSNPKPTVEKPAAPPSPPKRKTDDDIIVKIVRAVQPGDIVFIECDQARNQQQLDHLHTQLKQKLPDIRIVILNKGARVTEIQPSNASVQQS